ncbi:MAG: hypothetical protein QOE75_807 [Solirubrobacterales bacterium]|jgi:hypothetical protein|nr:hypothetical protein [Solirubrobacterales bacterium]
MPGLRVHITGSAAKDCTAELLGKAHSFVRELCEHLIADGEGLLLGAGGEPLGEAKLPCIFDWTCLEAVATAPEPAPDWPPERPERFVAVASQSGIANVPELRQETWEGCLRRTDFELHATPPGWRMASLIRDRQLLHGDVLLVLGGGGGAEHLAQLYRDDGKPVIPIHADIGSYSQDGNGGSRYLHEKALSEVDTFLRLRDGAGSAAARLASMRLEADTDTGALAAATISLITDLRPRPVFYVRLLDTADPDFESVESFFRDVVDPVMIERGFTPTEMGMNKPEQAFMNVEIFAALHRAGFVVVDLTGVRPNCTMEFGYALGRRRRVLISAKEGTKLPFDTDKLPTHFWRPDTPSTSAIASYGDHFDRFSELPPLVD